MRKLKIIVLVISSLALFVWMQVTQPFYIKSDTTTLPAPDPEVLKATVRKISQDYFPRDYSSTTNLDGLAEYIRQGFVREKGRTHLQTFMMHGKQYYNVIASFGPEDGERIIVGAHYDTAGRLPGADDNASGVAGLLALAGLLGEATLNHRVDLVAFTLEELPFFKTEDMGSAHYVRSLQAEGVTVRLMYSLEMIGYFSDEEDSQYYPFGLLKWFYPGRGNFIAVVGELFDGSSVRQVKSAMQSANDLPVYSINAPASVPGLDFSDHLNFWAAGYPAIMITDTAFYRNDEYHSPGDTYDRLDYERMAKVVQGVFASILAL